MEYLAKYHQHHCVCLKEWMHPDEVAQYVAKIKPSGWRTDTMTSDNFLFDVFTDPSLTQALNTRIFALEPMVRDLLGGQSASHFEGTVKRLQSGPKYRFPWHSDRSGGRIMGVSLCLAAGVGGDFEIRQKWSKFPHARLEHLEPGDVHLFDVSDPTLVHRVTPLQGPEPRIFFAGWFYASVCS